MIFKSTGLLLFVSWVVLVSSIRPLSAAPPVPGAFEASAEASEVLLALDDDELKREMGWSYGLSVGANLAYTHNRKMVGSLDGSMFQIGLVIDGMVSYHHPRHEWLNKLELRETFTKTPNIAKFLKTADSLDLSSTYFYHPAAISWLGPFGRLRMITSVFPGWTVRDHATTIRRQMADGTTVDADTETPAQNQIDLTGWFEPLAFKETAGIYANPISRKSVRLKLLAGLGAQQVLTRDGYVLSDDSDPDAIVLQQLRDYYQVGAEFEVDVAGALSKIVNWGVVLNIFQPMYSSEDRSMALKDLFEVKVDAKLSVKLASWVSLDYVLTVRRLPLIVDEWQVQNGLLLSAGFSLP